MLLPKTRTKAESSSGAIIFGVTPEKSILRFTSGSCRTCLSTAAASCSSDWCGKNAAIPHGAPLPSRSSARWTNPKAEKARCGRAGSLISSTGLLHFHVRRSAEVPIQECSNVLPNVRPCRVEFEEVVPEPRHHFEVHFHAGIPRDSLQPARLGNVHDPI